MHHWTLLLRPNWNEADLKRNRHNVLEWQLTSRDKVNLIWLCSRVPPAGAHYLAADFSSALRLVDTELADQADEVWVIGGSSLYKVIFYSVFESHLQIDHWLFPLFTASVNLHLTNQHRLTCSCLHNVLNLVFFGVFWGLYRSWWKAQESGGCLSLKSCSSLTVTHSSLKLFQTNTDCCQSKDITMF